MAGGSAFTLTVTGNNFISSSVVRWNGVNRTTTFVSATQLRAAISASDIATAGSAQVTVFTPAPGGGTSNALTFTISPSVPDLQLTSLSNPPAAAIVGTSFNVTDTTANTGTGSAGTSTTSYWLSLDATIASGDQQIGSREVPALGAGASSSDTVTVTVPTSLAPGNYYLGACADDPATVAESSETNNCRASTTTLTVGGLPTINSLSPVSGAVGASVTITGSNFGATEGSSTVTFNGVVATPTSWSDTTIVAPAPAGATAGQVVVTVQVANGVWLDYFDLFTSHLSRGPTGPGLAIAHKRPAIQPGVCVSPHPVRALIRNASMVLSSAFTHNEALLRISRLRFVLQNF
ncbi:MAG TPA: IPT/TIG domain-containing protein [Methylomirabilota bacterium]|nr:IPT/TIG domain-containing protein [Methylomirabilota bacterium]